MMPVLWQSSQRPMYVRTVWIDGFRHAILSHDDPCLSKLSKRRPHSSASCTAAKTKARARLGHHEDLEQCLRKFNFTISPEKSNIVKRKRPKSSIEHEHDIEKLQLVEIEEDADDEIFLKANSQPLNEFESCRSKFDSLHLNMRTIRSTRTARSEAKENTDLSDRVLQWLDLAGMVDLIKPENTERMSQPRHSWPEIQKRNMNFVKSKTTIDLRGKEGSKINSPKAGDSARTLQSGTIDRHDFYVPTSANTIENYARQSRNTRGTPLANGSKVRDKTKSRDLKANILETRQKMESERTALEKQYSELINKKIIPDMNKSSKKQVHIFMPEMPKNKINSTTSSRTESILSQRT